MRVNEFIEQLKKFPQNAEVMFAPPYRGQPYLPARTAMEILHLRTYLGKSEQTKEFCVVDEADPKGPSYQDLVDHIRWTQNLWRHGIEIMRENNLVIASDTPMEKLAFTFYSDLCEIDLRALHLFGEGPGDENYKDQSMISAQAIVPYPRPYEEGMKQAVREDERNNALPIINHAEALCKEIGGTGDWQSKIGFNALQILNLIAKYKGISLTDIIHKSEE